MIRALAVAALLGVSIAATAADSTPAPTRLDDLMQRLAQHQHGRASFEETEHLALLERPLTSTGLLLYDAPDRLEKRTLTPKPERLLLEHGHLEVHRGARTYSLNLSDAPQIAPFIDSIRATLAGDETALDRSYRPMFQSDSAGWSLELVPRAPALAASVSRIRMSGVGDRIQSVEIRRANGDWSLMTIHDLPPT
jgi:hypothetical protein